MSYELGSISTMLVRARNLAIARRRRPAFPIIRAIGLARRRTLAERRPSSQTSPEPMFADSAPIRSQPAVNAATVFEASAATAEAAYGAPLTELVDQDQDPIEVKRDMPAAAKKPAPTVGLIAVVAALALFGLTKRGKR